ncbi:hypothetical protein HPB47_007869 [Ixodes persulcatus]|uniref:Uncharacterized protein n=1 Tax=Ixodes persulcatus TaxID=34615 RepID=A0AC60P6N1_IXOPE|nr:hypothetical protein HPB47_007869 [Ixodes persulcatus]
MSRILTRGARVGGVVKHPASLNILTERSVNAIQTARTMDIETFYSDVQSKHLHAREKYEEGKKKQKIYKTVAIAFGTVAAIGAIGAISVATAGLADVGLLVASSGAVVSLFTSLGTGLKAYCLKRKNKKDSTNSARHLAADLEEEDEQSFGGECDADDRTGLIRQVKE